MLNLLPPEIKKQYRAASKVYGVLLSYFIVTIIIALLAAVLFTYNFRNTVVISDKQTQLDGLKAEKKQASKLADKIALIEDRLNLADKYREQHTWDKLLDIIATDTPSNIQLTSLKLTTDPAKGTSLVTSGQTTDRRAIVLNKEKLATEKQFTAVDIQTLTETLGVDGKKVFNFTIGMGVTNVNP